MKKEVNSLDLNHFCIFEKKICEHAENKNHIFNCTCPSDEEMPCNRSKDAQRIKFIVPSNKCVKGKELKVLICGAGYYIGTYDDEGPYCRVSRDYFKTEAEAQKALDTRFAIRFCVENDYCSLGRGCFGSTK